MTIYEHAMLSINGALALGLQKRYDWQIVALAGVLAVVPDWDGVSILFNVQSYAQGHRIWGHNFFVAGLMAVVVSVFCYRFDLFARIHRWLAVHWSAFTVNNDRMDARESDRGPLVVWVIVGMAAAYSHLLADMLFSVGKNLPVWGVPLFWPFSGKEYSYPMVAWGDVGPTIIFAASMFFMLRWPKWTSKIAFASLILVISYSYVAGTLRGCGFL
jgi:membrane-bound metal-dependent hydrolase YbcI (DUF457 family)